MCCLVCYYKENTKVKLSNDYIKNYRRLFCVTYVTQLREYSEQPEITGAASK